MAESGSTGNGFVTKLTQLFALYVVYVFLSGWTFFDYYFRKFQIDPRWLDLPVQEILAKGFTVLFTGGQWIWLIYLLMLFGPIAVDEVPAIHTKFQGRVAVTALLFAALIGLYFVSRNAGIAEADIDEGPRTRLPLVTFSRKTESGSTGTSKVDFTGHALAFRNGVFYLQNVSALNDQNSKTIGLWVVRLEDLTEVQIAER
jgi:hypothetical protein